MMAKYGSCCTSADKVSIYMSDPDPRSDRCMMRRKSVLKPHTFKLIEPGKPNGQSLHIVTGSVIRSCLKLIVGSAKLYVVVLMT
jgi:hypothetical protein